VRVVLKNNWFAPANAGKDFGGQFRGSGQLFEAVSERDGGTEIPDHLRPFLPKSAKIISGAPAEETAKAVEDHIANHDPGRAMAEAQGKQLDVLGKRAAEFAAEVKKKG